MKYLWHSGKRDNIPTSIYTDFNLVETPMYMQEAWRSARGNEPSWAVGWRYLFEGLVPCSLNFSSLCPDPAPAQKTRSWGSRGVCSPGVHGPWWTPAHLPCDICCWRHVHSEAPRLAWGPLWVSARGQGLCARSSKCERCSEVQRETRGLRPEASSPAATHRQGHRGAPLLTRNPSLPSREPASHPRPQRGSRTYTADS